MFYNNYNDIVRIQNAALKEAAKDPRCNDPDDHEVHREGWRARRLLDRTIGHRPTGEVVSEIKEDLDKELNKTFTDDRSREIWNLAQEVVEALTPSELK